MKKEDYIKKWLTDSLNDKEKARFEQTEDFRIVQKLSNALRFFRSPEYDLQSQYEDLKARTSKVVFMSSLIRYGIAASILLALGIAFYFSWDKPDIQKTPLTINKQEMVLPDDSEVILNKQSSLSYDRTGWKRNRKAMLTGEAFFQVAEGSWFDIHTSSGVVSVLGTTFNIKDRRGLFEVKCYEGKVSVVTPSEQLILTANQVFRMVNGTSAVYTSENGRVPSWVQGESSFDRIPYWQVLAEMERQYGVQIEYEDIDSALLFTGKFTHDDLILALKSITTPFSVRFTLDDRQVKLISEHQ